MISIGEDAQAHFQRLLAQQAIEDLGVRVRVVHPGTPKADCQLEFCEPSDLRGDEWVVECEGFNLYVEAEGAKFLEGATIDFQKSATGGQLTIKAPHIKGHEPGAQATVIERIRYLLDAEINPGLASHGGRVSLSSLEADGTAVLQFGGGCHGCGMVDVTLRGGIERTLRERIPEITGVRDATDHSTGTDPYMRKNATA
jgi:Fe/S biogenesis protein NfuA